jgi:16S rRNA C1402 N4-methylase RsmH
MNHIPVLENEIVNIFSYLSAIKDTIFVDGTIGNAGHSISIAKKTGTQVIAIDKDQSAINLSKKNISSKKFIALSISPRNLEGIFQRHFRPQLVQECR